MLSLTHLTCSIVDCCRLINLVIICCRSRCCRWTDIINVVVWEQYVVCDVASACQPTRCCFSFLFRHWYSTLGQTTCTSLHLMLYDKRFTASRHPARYPKNSVGFGGKLTKNHPKKITSNLI